MKCMLKKMGLLVILFTIAFSVSASVYSNYDKAVKNTDTFITKFDKYKLYLETTDMYLYNGKLSAKAGFNNGGFISTYEFNTTINNKDSYLITGSRYFTMTDSSDMVDVVNLRKITNENKNSTFESRVTEYIIPETKITGSGSRNDPWVFKMPKYKITINLSNAAIDGSNNFVDTVYGYNATYLISPDTFYHFKNNDGDLSCSSEANVVLANDKISFKNISSDVTCNVKYRGDIVTASIIVNNGTAANSTLSGEVGKDLSTTITASTGYAFSNVSCTNSQNATYASKTITINKISNYTTCTLDYVKVPTVNPTGDGTYTVPATGYYLLTAAGAQGSESGGKGGQVVGEISLNTGEVLTIDIGGTNGYNGGGAYNNTKYVQGGGATTVKYNSATVITAAGGGGGATGTAGGSGNGSGGASVGAGAGLAGSNGGGGSKSLNYSAKVNCRQTGGDCIRETTTECCHRVCSGSGYTCTRWASNSSAYEASSGACGIIGCTGCVCNGEIECSTCTECAAYSPVTETCDTQVTSGKGGNGGANATTSVITNVTKSNGINSGNGKLIIQYIGE